YPAEKAKMRALTEIRDKAIWTIADGSKFDTETADKDTPALPEVKTNYKSKSEGVPVDYKYGEEAVKTLTVPEGYKVELFASEKEFPNLANPMQMNFDTKGRLWVATMPTYPHWRPGDP